MVDGQVKSMTVGPIKKEIPTHVGQDGNVIKITYRRGVGNSNCSWIVFQILHTDFK
jgi:hypothetical protein